MSEVWVKRNIPIGNNKFETKCVRKLSVDFVLEYSTMCIIKMIYGLGLAFLLLISMIGAPLSVAGLYIAAQALVGICEDFYENEARIKLKFCNSDVLFLTRVFAFILNIIFIILVVGTYVYIYVTIHQNEISLPY